VVVLSVTSDLKITQLDVKTAYLNSNIDTEIYISKPELLEEMLRRMIYQESGTELASKAEKMLSQLVGVNRVCRFKRALYGLKQTERQWYERLKETLWLLGLVPTKSDPCIFVDNNNG